jgi:hypothetical protein
MQTIDVLGGMLGGAAVLNFFITVDGEILYSFSFSFSTDHCLHEPSVGVVHASWTNCIRVHCVANLNVFPHVHFSYFD